MALFVLCFILGAVGSYAERDKSLQNGVTRLSQWVKASDSVCLWPPNGKYNTFSGFLQKGKFFSATHAECPITSAKFLNCSWVEFIDANNRSAETSTGCFHDKETDNLCVGSRRSGRAKGGRLYSAWVGFSVNCTGELQEVAYEVTVPHNPSGSPFSCISPPKDGFCSNNSLPPAPNPPSGTVTLQGVAVLFQQRKQTLLEYTADQLLVDNLMNIDVLEIGNSVEAGLEFQYPIILSGKVAETYHTSIIYSQSQALSISPDRFSITYKNSPTKKETISIHLHGEHPNGSTLLFIPCRNSRDHYRLLDSGRGHRPRCGILEEEINLLLSLSFNEGK